MESDLANCRKQSMKTTDRLHYKSLSQPLFQAVRIHIHSEDLYAFLMVVECSRYTDQEFQTSGPNSKEWALIKSGYCVWSELISAHFSLRPRPYYTVFKWKRYCFAPFWKRFASTLIVSYPFRPFTLQRVSVLKTLLNLIVSYNLPPDSFSITFLATN